MNSPWIAFFSWYMAISVLGWLALPVTITFFRRLPDRGFSFSKLAGLLLAGYLFWLANSLGLATNDLGGALFAVALLGSASFLCFYRGRLGDLRGWLCREWRAWLGVELVFLAAFAGWSLVRAYNPEILGAEKPMELMMINSVLRSPTFPPQDAWLAGHAISYYYFGYVLVALIARMTGTAAEITFNLGLSLTFALAAVAILGVVMNMIALARRSRAGEPGVEPELQRVFFPALLGPLLVLVVGNFFGVAELAYRNGWGAEARLLVPTYDFGADPAEPVDAQRGARFGWVGWWEWLDLAHLPPPAPPSEGGFQWRLPQWWFGSRVINDRDLVGTPTPANVIDEMPIFSFVHGDLHPHVVGLPFSALAAAVALEWLLWGWARSNRAAGEPGNERPDAGRMLGTGIVLGGLAFLNTWDLPIYWFLVTAALAAGLFTPGLGKTFQPAWRTLITTSGILLLASVGLYFPFYLTLQSQAGGILPNLIHPTRFQQSLIFWGPVLPGVLLFLAWAAWRHRRTFNRRGALLTGVGLLAGLAVFAAALTLLAASSPELVAFVDRAIQPLNREQAVRLMLERRLVDSLASLLPALMVALSAGLLLHDRRAGAVSPAVLFAAALALTGALLALGPEFLYLRDNFGVRVNTVFKFYFQAWLLWGMTAAFGTWLIAEHGSKVVRFATTGLVAVLVLGGSIYTGGALWEKTQGSGEPPTLDGLAYFERAYPHEWAAIQWLEKNAGRADKILEGTRGAYWGEGPAGRISMATGLPTLMGWDNHERQWRGPYFAQVEHRLEEIRTIYTSREWAAANALLEAYDIRYVIVSNWERQWYGRVETAKFERNLRLVFESGDVSIYER